MDTGHIQTVLVNGTKRTIGDFWLMLVDRFTFHMFCIIVIAMKPDMVLYSECERLVYFTELTIAFEDVIKEPFKRKKPMQN